MATIHLHETTTSTPEQFVAVPIDFGPGRSKLFGRSADDILRFVLDKTVNAIEARTDSASTEEGTSRADPPEETSS
jgi:hypothetical protein